jgi:hypothetical protein
MVSKASSPTESSGVITIGHPKRFSLRRRPPCRCGGETFGGRDVFRSDPGLGRALTRYPDLEFSRLRAAFSLGATAHD